MFRLSERKNAIMTNKQWQIDVCNDMIETYSRALATNDFSELYNFRITGKHTVQYMIKYCQKQVALAKKDLEELSRE